MLLHDGQTVDLLTVGDGLIVRSERLALARTDQRNALCSWSLLVVVQHQVESSCGPIATGTAFSALALLVHPCIAPLGVF